MDGGTMIKQYMVDTQPCPVCGRLVYPSDIHIFHIDDPSPNGSGFLWAYQEKRYDTIELQFECACRQWNDRIQVFVDHAGDLFISPLQTVMDSQGVLKKAVES